MKSPNKVKKELYAYLDEDWMPLHAIVGSFLNYQKSEPGKEEFIEILGFISKILEEKDIICLEGPEMTKVNGSGKEIVKWILKLYEREGYVI